MVMLTHMKKDVEWSRTALFYPFLSPFLFDSCHSHIFAVAQKQTLQKHISGVMNEGEVREESEEREKTKKHQLKNSFLLVVTTTSNNKENNDNNNNDNDNQQHRTCCEICLREL